MMRVSDWVAVSPETPLWAHPKHTSFAHMDAAPLFADTARAASIWLSQAPRARHGSHFATILLPSCLLPAVLACVCHHVERDAVRRDFSRLFGPPTASSPACASPRRSPGHWQ